MFDMVLYSIVLHKMRLYLLLGAMSFSVATESVLRCFYQLNILNYLFTRNAISCVN